MSPRQFNLDLLTREIEDLQERLAYWTQAYVRLLEDGKSITPPGCATRERPSENRILPPSPRNSKPMSGARGY